MKLLTKITLILYLFWIVVYVLLGNTNEVWSGVYFGVQALLWVAVLNEFRIGWMEKPVSIIMGFKSAEVLYCVYSVVDYKGATSINHSDSVMCAIGVLIGIALIVFKR